MRIDERRSGRTLLVSLVVASLVVMTVYFREGDRGPLHAARRVVTTIMEPVVEVGDLAVGPFRSVWRWSSGLRVSPREAEELRRQNKELRRRLAALEEARLENERLREVVRFGRAQKLRSRVARVIGRPATSWERSIFLDLGSADGVRAGMPVIASDGLLGQVIDASSRSARVLLIGDQSSGVAALVQSTRVAGVVRGTVGGELRMEYVDRKKTPKVGDLVVTSGLGGIYPKGIPVGEVTEVSEDRSGLYPEVRLVSRVALARVEEVLVLTHAAPEVKVGDGE